MPKPSVFTPEQQAYLRTYVDMFHDARKRRRRLQFKEDVGQPFLEKWPEVVPDSWEPTVAPPPLPPLPGIDPADLPPLPPPPPSPERQRKEFLDDLEKRRKDVSTI